MEQNLFDNPEQPSSLFQMNLDAQNSYNLRSAASWAKVLGVVGMILGAIFCILAFIALVQLSGYDDSYYGYRRRGGLNMFGSSVGGTRTGLWILVITGIIFITGGIFSFNFGNKMNIALRSNSQQDLNQGFAALRNYFAIRSITLIILLLLLLISYASRV